jgi:hypothetical protein
LQHVTEITLAPSAQNAKPKRVKVLRRNTDGGGPGDIEILTMEDDSDAETDIDEPWTYFNPEETPNNAATPIDPQPTPQSHHPPRYLSARVAAWIIPKLPPTPVAPSKFRLGAARLAGQRMYLATYPFYAPFISDLLKLAAWSDWHRSARVCASWWLFWYFNLLLPALLGKILFSLLRRGIMRNPTLAELRQRRKVAEEAGELSDTMGGYGAGASFFGTGSVPGVGQGGGDMGFRDMWKLAKLVTKGKGKKSREKAKQAGNAVASQVGTSIEFDAEDVDHSNENGDWRSSTLKALEDIADFHERVRK